MHVCNAQTQHVHKTLAAADKCQRGAICESQGLPFAITRTSNRPVLAARNSPNGATFEGLPAGPDRRRRFVADRRSMKADVRSLDAMVG